MQFFYSLLNSKGFIQVDLNYYNISQFEFKKLGWFVSDVAPKLSPNPLGSGLAVESGLQIAFE
jgi:hypothetical protein